MASVRARGVVGRSAACSVKWWRRTNGGIADSSFDGLTSRRARLSSSSSSASSSSARPGRIIFSGIQPTGIPHLGNYLGALRNWVDLQNNAQSDDQLFFSIVGLHAMTVPFEPTRLRAERRDMMAALLAVGLDPQRVTLFHQDEVPEHAELAWYLNCITSVGKLNRMTTWKSKLATIRADENTLCLGLFAYPVLQAADILLYRATHVPVGEDQVQHLELSRDLADLYNRTFNAADAMFPLPQHVITPTKRVLSLRDPTQKMSKSAPDESSRILLTDDDNTIQRKIKRAVTDSEPVLSYDPSARPGVSNLLSILAACAGGGERSSSPPPLSAQDWADELNARAHGGAVGRVLKEAVTEAIVATVRPVREAFERLRADPSHLEALERFGRDKARERAADTMQKVRRLAGLSSSL